MPSKKSARRLLDIIENGQFIREYVTGLDRSGFQRNRIVRDAVERCLERISEAIAKLGDQAPVLLPGQPCSKIRGFGNVLRHDYDMILVDRIWSIVQEDLQPLLQACEVALQTISERDPPSRAAE